MYDSLGIYLTLALLMGNHVFAHKDYPLVSLTKQKHTPHHEHGSRSSTNFPSQPKTSKKEQLKQPQYLTSKTIGWLIKKPLDTFSHITSVTESIRNIEYFAPPSMIRNAYDNLLFRSR